MPYIKSVNIPKPCHETWQAMAPVSNGRYCQACCKTVTDFTAMSNDEIITHLSVNHNICGRFNTAQITNINNRLQIDYTPAIPKLSGWALILAMLGPVTFCRAAAQSKPPTVQTNCNSAPKSETNIILGKAVPLYKIITGIVTDEQNLPLAGAVVNASNSKSFVTTNMDGKFSLHVPASATEIDVHFVGFIISKITLDANASQHNYIIKLKEASNLTGKLVIVKKPSFVKHIYFRYVRRPYRALKKKLASL